MTINYRESYDIFATSGILFNHESPLRGTEFVTRKITCAVAKIKNNLQHKLELGNLDAERDWGYAKDYVNGMYMMMQADNPDTFILATNKSYTVRDFAKLSFNAAGIDIFFEGSGVNERGYDKKSGKLILEINKNYFRPAEVEYLRGDFSHAKKTFNWTPKTSLESLCQMMVESDLHNISLI